MRLRLRLRLRRRPASAPLLLLLLSLLLAGVAATVVGAEAALRQRLVDGRDPVGSPGDIAWQAWLLMDAEPPPAGEHDAGAPTVTRRIAPKSVFIAPAFSPQALPACAEGYRSDSMGRCVKLVKVDPAAQISFLLQRLNALYAPLPTARPPAAGPAMGPEVRPLAAPLAHTQDGPMQVPLSLSPSQPTNGADEEPEASSEQPESLPPRPLMEPPKEPLKESLKEPPKEVIASSKPVTLPTSNGEGSSLDGVAPVQVSVVMAEVDKRSSSEEAADSNGESSDTGSNFTRPVVPPRTNENKTVEQSSVSPPVPSKTVENKTMPQSSVGEAFTVEIAADSDAEAVSATEEPSSSESGTGTTTLMTTTPAALVEVLAEVLAPSDVGDAFPMLVISPGPTSSPPATPPATPPPRAELLNDAHNSSSQEGSGEVVEAAVSDLESTSGTGVAVEDMEGAGAALEAMESENTGTTEDEEEIGSADSPEQVEVVVADSDNGNHHFSPPVLLPDEEDQMGAFSHAPVASGQAESSDWESEKKLPHRGFIRFPSPKDQDEPTSLFKGGFFKYPPQDNTYPYREGEASVSTQPEGIRQAFWWLPRGWRVDGQQRPVSQQMRDLWARFPISSDSSLPSHHPHAYPAPLPYHQRQAQYDSQWPDMQRRMTSA